MQNYFENFGSLSDMLRLKENIFKLQCGFTQELKCCNWGVIDSSKRLFQIWLVLSEATKWSFSNMEEIDTAGFFDTILHTISHSTLLFEVQQRVWWRTITKIPSGWRLLLPDFNIEKYYSRNYAKLIHTGVCKYFVQVFHIWKNALSNVDRISIWSSLFANDLMTFHLTDIPTCAQI